MRAELEELQGTWDIVALEIEGATMGESAFRGSQMVVKGNAFTAVGMGDTYKGKLKVDTAKTPKTLDLAFEEGPEKGNKSLAIYELDGDTWRLCLTLTAKDRPGAFATKAGSGLALETLKRRKGPGGPDALREEIARLEGEWSLVSGERDGQPLPKDFLHNGRRLVKGNETTVRFGVQVFLKAAFSPGPSNKPKTMDYILTAGPNQGEIQYGIYELEGDTVTLCFAPPGRPRPVDFNTRAGDGGMLTVWKRKRK